MTRPWRLKGTARCQKVVPFLPVLAVLASCGHAPAPLATTGALAGSHLLVANGQARHLGYDVERYRTQLQGRAHLEHFPHAALPPAADLRGFCPPVYDQGNMNSCTAFAWGKGLAEYYQRKRLGATAPLSALWLYYKERVHMGPDYVGHDGGANLVDGAAVLTEQGMAAEALWPYKLRFLTTPPSAEADRDAAGRKLSRAMQLASFDDMKGALAAGHPVPFGFIVTDALLHVGADGMVPLPRPGDAVRGGHAVVAVGYDDARQLLVVRNSWGDQWGDAGYCYMPYAFARDESYMLERWTAE